MVTARGRPDLAHHLDGAREALTQRQFTVAVVGEFKRGKSTLINALLRTAVCPVDADVVTGVPTIVRYGPDVAVFVRAQHGSGAEVQTREVSLRDMPDLVSDPPDGRSESGQRSVEIRLPHRMLRTGLRLVDTPGVGGLESVHGQLTLGALSEADGVLFVTDASQELSGPEMSFLQSTVEKCPRTALVITKIDLHARWRRIVELNTAHLREANLEVPIIPVSSFLRLRSATDPTLAEEAAFEPLVRFLATQVVAPRIEEATVSAAAGVSFVTEQLTQAATAERAVLERPQEAQMVVEKIAATSRQATALSASSATWQQTLADGVQDLVADVEHDLQGRLRRVLREVEGVIDESDPKDAWDDTDLWLRRQVAEVAVLNRDMLLRRARELAASVAAEFDLASDHEFAISEGDHHDAVAQVNLADSTLMSTKAGKLSTIMVAARSTAFLPMLVFGASAVLGPFLVPVGLTAVALSAGLGRKVIKDEAQRQRAHRQQQAKAAARRFIDEVAFVMNKESRDGLRDTQRRLRDEFQTRAGILARSTQASLEAVNQASRLNPADRAARTKVLREEAEQLADVGARARHAMALGRSGTS
ncbi:MAG: dynamin family protein [Ornithinimicrobium sp.]